MLTRAASWSTTPDGAVRSSDYGDVIEVLEDRSLLSTFYVDNNGDFVVTTNNSGGPGADPGDVVTWDPGTGSAHGNAVTGLVFGTDAFDSIQSALAAASASGDTINVGPGTFAEGNTVTKSVTIRGNQFGVDAKSGRTGAAETILSNAGGAFGLTADGIVLDGLVVQDQTNGNAAPGFGYGIYLTPGYSGRQVLNSIIQNNIVGMSLANSGVQQAVIQGNLFKNNNNAGPASGHGIYLDEYTSGAVDNVLIDSNRFEGQTSGGTGQGIGFSSTAAAFPTTNVTLSHNEFDGNGRALYAFNLQNSQILNNTLSNATWAASADMRLFEGCTNLTISGNLMQNGTGYAVRISDAGTGLSVASDINLVGNSITGYGQTVAVAIVSYSGTFNASGNYWGSNDPATVASRVSGTVDFTPWLDVDTDTNLIAAGFQGDFSVLNVDDAGAQSGVDGRITEGIGLLASPGTLKIHAGSYTENVSAAGKDVNLSPGSSPAQVTIIGDLTLDSSDTLTIEINGTAAATDFDNFVVNGSVDLGGATLAPLSGSHTPSGSDSFTIISATGTVSNTFLNLPDGSAVSLNGNPLSVDYDTNSVVLSFDSTPVFTGTAGADDFVVSIVGGVIVVTQNGVTILMTSAGSLDSLTINGGDDDDTFVLDLGNGNPIPSGGLFFNGNGGDDALGVLGTGGESVTYTPSATVNGEGAITIDGTTLNFTGLEPVDFDNVGTFTLSLPGADDVVDVAEGFNSAVTGGAEPAGTVPALVFSGTSGGVPFESAHVFRTTNVILDTTLITDGDDIVTVTSGDNAHGNTNLTIITGGSLITPDSVTINGNLTVSGTLTISTETLAVNALVDAESTGANVVLTVKDIDVQGTITASGVGGRINISSPVTHSIELGTVGDAGANIVELSDAELDNLTASVVQLVSNGPTLTITGPISPDGTSTLFLSAFSIVDGNVTDPDITETNLRLEGLGGIGTTADPLEIDVDNLSAKEGSPGAEIALRNSGDLTITAVDLQSGVQKSGAAGNIDIATTGTLNINAPVLNSGGGDILLGADAAINQNETVSASGGNGNIELTAGTNVTLSWFVTAAGTGTITSTAGTGGLTTIAATGNVSTADSAITFHTDDMSIDAAGVISSGSGTTSIDPVTAATAISLGTSAAMDLELTDVELDRITAGTLTVGNSTSGDITITDAVTRSAATNINLTTGVSIIFSGATGSLDANGGDVTLTAGAAGGVTSGDATTDVAADDLTITAGSGGIGASGNLLTTNVTTLTTDTSSANGDQFIHEASGLSDLDLNAGTGDITLVVGGQVSDTAADGTDVTADAFDLTIAVGTSGEFGAGGNFIETNVNSLTSSTSNQDRNIYVNEFDDLVIESINVGQTVFPDIHLQVGGNVTSGAGVILGNGLNLTAGGFIDIDTTVSQLNLTTTANGNVIVDETNNLSQLNIDAGTGDVTITAGGAITDGDGTLDITAKNISLTATSVATSANPLSTSADTLTIDTAAANGDQFVTEADGLTDLNLNAGTGNVSLALALGSVLDTAADGTDITATDASVTLSDATSQTIGASGNPIEFDVSTLATSTSAGNGDQFLSDPDTVTVNDSDMASGMGTMTLVNGTYLTTPTGSMLGNVVVESGVVLGGSGTVTGTVQVNPGGTVAPGASTAILNTGSVTFTAGSDFDVEVNGNVAGTSYDQLNVTGTVTLGGATLNATGTIPSMTGQTIVIINNDDVDAVNGTFAGLAEGDTVFINGIGFKLSYQGGTGNDVTLTELIQVTVTVSPLFVAEDSHERLVYTFHRNGILDVMTVNFGISGTAVVDEDYIDPSSRVIAGNSTGTFRFGFGDSDYVLFLIPRADTAVELDETITLTLLPGSTYVPGVPTSATGTIQNDDSIQEVSVAVSPASVTENGSDKLTYTFTRSGGSVYQQSQPLTVNFAVGGGANNATFGTDYTVSGAKTFDATSGTVSFGYGNSTAKVTVDPTSDLVFEPDETVVLTLTADPNYNVVAPTAATGTITNDDVPLPEVSVSVSPDVSEDGTATLVYTFTRTSTALEPLTANFSVGGSATFSTDYSASGAKSFTATTGSVTFGFGQTTATVVIDPMADLTIEPSEDVILTVTAGTNYTIGGSNQAIGQILNDDSLPTVELTVAPLSVAEDGAPNLVYTFTRTGNLSVPLLVNFAVGGSATLTTDYTASGARSFTATTGTVRFGFGDATAKVIVNPRPDTLVEGNEDVVLTLAPNASYNIGGNNSATGTITEDDSTQTVEVAVSPAGVLEDGSPNLVYTFTRSGGSALQQSQSLTVNFTVGGSAGLSTDYTVSGARTFTATTGSVRFGSGNATAKVTVNPKADFVVESDEDVLLTIAADAQYVIGGNNAALGTIQNDDFTPTIQVTVSPANIQEGSTQVLVFTFTRSNTALNPLTVNFSVGGGANEATFGTDYTQSGARTFSGTAGTVRFGNGNSTVTVLVKAKADLLAEPNESVTLKVLAGTGYDVGVIDTAIGTILDALP